MERDNYPTLPFNRTEVTVPSSQPLINTESSVDIFYLQAATRPNTRRAYQQDIQHFIASGGILPTTPDHVLRYLHTYAEQLNPRTLARRLVALRHWHTYQGFPDPTAHAVVKKTLRGIQNTHGQPKRKAPALTFEYLRQLVIHLNQQTDLIAVRNNALLQVGFFAALRRSELVGIQVEHITFMPEGMEILIPRSKTDPTGEGQVCAIPKGDDILCAVSAVKKWCAVAGIESGFLFRAINRHQQISKYALSSDSASRIIKAFAVNFEWTNSEKFSGHSMRRGFVTSASKKGASLNMIMQQGRWKDVRTVQSYIEEGQRFEENAVNVLMQTS